MSREQAMIARFDGDEFGIVVENTATTPDIATTMTAINDDLAPNRPSWTATGCRCR